MAASDLLPFPGRAEDNEALTINRNADNTINYIERVANGVTLRQTWSYTNTFPTSVSIWVTQ